MTWWGKPIARWLNVQMSNWEQGQLGGKRSKIKKDLERQPHLKGVNTSECACVYMCFNTKKSSFQHARGRWVQCWGREPSRLVGCAGQEEVETCFGLPISVGTQGKSEKKKMGRCGRRSSELEKLGRRSIPDSVKYWCTGGTRLVLPGETPVCTVRWAPRGTGTGSPISAFGPLKKYFSFIFTLIFFPLCCLHWQGWIFFLLNLAASVWLRGQLSEREKAKQENTAGRSGQNVGNWELNPKTRYRWMLRGWLLIFSIF